MAHTVRDRILPVYEAVIPFLTLNLLWVMVSLPLVTLIPASAALLYAMNRHAHGRTADWSVFFDGFRRWFLRSYLWGGLNVVVITVLVSNIAFYAQLETNWGTVPMALAAFLLVLWLLLQITTFPLMLQQEVPSLRLALRNSLVILARRPLRLLGYGLVIGGLVTVSIFVLPVAWIFITASLSAFLMNRATIGALRALVPVSLPADELSTRH